MNQDQLVGLYRAHESIQKLFAALQHEVPKEGRTTVEELSEVGGVSRTDAIALLRELANCGCGKFTVGRRGHPSRLEWSVNPAQLSEQLAQLSEQLAQARIATSQTPAESEGVRDEPKLALVEPTVAAGFSLTPPSAVGKAKSRVRTSTPHMMDPKMVEHAYVLRPDLRLSVNLPVDLTQREAEVLAAWVRNLSFER